MNPIEKLKEREQPEGVSGLDNLDRLSKEKLSFS